MEAALYLRAPGVPVKRPDGLLPLSRRAAARHLPLPLPLPLRLHRVSFPSEGSAAHVGPTRRCGVSPAMDGGGGGGGGGEPDGGLGGGHGATLADQTLNTLKAICLGKPSAGSTMAQMLLIFAHTEIYREETLDALRRVWSNGSQDETGQKISIIEDLIYQKDYHQANDICDELLELLKEEGPPGNGKDSRPYLLKAIIIMMLIVEAMLIPDARTEDQFSNKFDEMTKEAKNQWLKFKKIYEEWGKTPIPTLNDHED